MQCTEMAMRITGQNTLWWDHPPILPLCMGRVGEPEGWLGVLLEWAVLASVSSVVHWAVVLLFNHSKDAGWRWRAAHSVLETVWGFSRGVPSRKMPQDESGLFFPAMAMWYCFNYLKHCMGLLRLRHGEQHSDLAPE